MRDLTSKGCFDLSTAFQGNEPLLTTFTCMKFLKWCESVDHLVIPLAIDFGLTVFGAGLVTASLRYIFELAA